MGFQIGDALQEALVLFCKNALDVLVEMLCMMELFGEAILVIILYCLGTRMLVARLVKLHRKKLVRIVVELLS